MAAADAERREAAILYAELRNFTRLSEVLPPEKVLELANDFFSFCAMAVTANKGKVLSVQNDMLVAAFAAAERKDFARRALKAAQDVRREFGGVSDQWKTQYGLPAAVSSALHLGEAVFGMGGPIGARRTGGRPGARWRGRRTQVGAVAAGAGEPRRESVVGRGGGGGVRAGVVRCRSAAGRAVYCEARPGGGRRRGGEPRAG